MKGLPNRALAVWVVTCVPILVFLACSSQEIDASPTPVTDELSPSRITPAVPVKASATAVPPTVSPVVFTPIALPTPVVRPDDVECSPRSSPQPTELDFLTKRFDDYSISRVEPSAIEFEYPVSWVATFDVSDYFRNPVGKFKIVATSPYHCPSFYHEQDRFPSIELYPVYNYYDCSTCDPVQALLAYLEDSMTELSRRPVLETITEYESTVLGLPVQTFVTRYDSYQLSPVIEGCVPEPNVFDKCMRSPNILGETFFPEKIEAHTFFTYFDQIFLVHLQGTPDIAENSMEIYNRFLESLKFELQN